MEMSDSIDKLFPAFRKAQSEMSGAVKESDNPFFTTRYADLGSVIKAIKQAATDNGLSYTQHPFDVPGQVIEEVDSKGKPTHRVVGAQIGVETLVMHDSGQWMKSRYALPMVKADPQAAGSAITYARRYALAAIFSVPVADDDANAAQFRTAPDGKEGERSTLANLVDQGDLEGAAKFWVQIPTQDEKVAVFTKLDRETKAVMQSQEFATACEVVIQKPKRKAPAKKKAPAQGGQNGAA